MPIPINMTTLNRLYGLNMTTEQGSGRLSRQPRRAGGEHQTSEDVVINGIGRELYQKFFRGYTRKQWGLDPSQLDKSVTSRIPTRTNTDDRYFTDTFQQMPKHGYEDVREDAGAPNIKVMLTDYREIRDEVQYDHLIFCGPIDEYFDYRFGKLPYRSLKFEHKQLDQEQFQAVGTVNYPSEDVPYTRISEYKAPHRAGPKTSITYEYPSAGAIPTRSRGRRTPSCTSAISSWRTKRRT